MILGTVNAEGNLVIKSSHTFGYDWFAGGGGKGGTVQDRYVPTPGTGGSKPQPAIVGGSGCKEVCNGKKYGTY